MSLDSAVRSRLDLTPALSLRADRDVVELLSASCHACVPCRRGLPDHCTSPAAATRVVAWESVGAAAPSLAAWGAMLAAVDQLAHSGGAAPRVGLVGRGDALALMRDCLASGGILALVAEPDGDLDQAEVRRLSSLLREGGHGTAGPPDVVVAVDGDLGLASRLVRRGGVLAAPVTVTSPVEMTALVQRELTVVPTRDMAGTAAGSPCLRTVGAWTRREEPVRG
ncbi:MAG: hypothetical protein JWN22_3553 [Nocardioides sp.]|nr:hypothetical protein [Nocardioides sp.]